MGVVLKMKRSEGQTAGIFWSMLPLTLQAAPPPPGSNGWGDKMAPSNEGQPHILGGRPGPSGCHGLESKAIESHGKPEKTTENQRTPGKPEKKRPRQLPKIRASLFLASASLTRPGGRPLTSLRSCRRPSRPTSRSGGGCKRHLSAARICFWS